MAHQYRLSELAIVALAEAKKEATEILGVLYAAVTELSNDRDEHMDAFEEGGARWQDGERGQEVAAWLTDLETLVDSVGTAMDALRAIEDAELEEGV